MRFLLYGTLLLAFAACDTRSKPAPGNATPAKAAAAEEGTNHGGGGGDPLAPGYLEIARLLEKAQAAGRIDLGLEASVLKVKINAIEASLEGQKPLLQFPAGSTVDCFGAPKLGCVDDLGVTRIARDGWIAAPLETKIEVTTMELVKVSGGYNRYSIAESVSRTLEFKKNLGPAGLVKDGDDLDVSSQPLLNEHSRTAVNRALSLVRHGKWIPQFDVTIASTIKRETTPDDLERSCHGAWERTIFVSGMVSLDPPTPASTMVLRQAFAPCSKTGLTESVFGGDGKPISELIMTEGSERFFKVCEATALNEAIARASRDVQFTKAVKFDPTGWRLRSYEVLSMYGSGRRLEKNTMYLISLLVSYDNFRLPYTYRILTRDLGESCRVLDVTLH